MDKTILKDFAIYSRNKLIEETKLKASMLGISEKGITNPLSESTSDMLAFDIQSIETHKIHGSDVRKYHRLVNELNSRTKTSEDYLTAYTSLIEEVAYTWFNRLLAIRFMEVNNYMPDRVRVLSNSQKVLSEPEIMSQYNATSIGFSKSEEEQLIEWQLDGSALAMNSMFQFLFIKQCNKLNDNLPDLFEKTDDYTELLLTISYNDQEGILYKLVNEIPEAYFDIESSDSYGQIEIIGWMYQYYNTELKDEVFARPASQKISKHDIPAATQLFTPDWIVKYMVENSLGRLWIEKLITEGESRSEKEIAGEFGWKYYIPEAAQEEEVTKELIKIRNERVNLRLEEIKFMDPAMGSFHIGVYAFDVFMQLYKSQGYVEREAAISIIENNLYGIDIDKRAYQLSYFAIMMKGRQYNRRLLSQIIKNNLNTIEESNNINRDDLEYFGNSMKVENKNLAKKEIDYLIENFLDAKEYGSILKINELNWDNLFKFINDVNYSNQVTLDNYNIRNTQRDLSVIIESAKVLSSNYDIVVTNPPYLGSRGMNSKLSIYLRINYPISKSDLFAVFMEKCQEMTKNNSYYALITQHSWMFLSTYEKLRKELQNNNIQNMLHLGTRAFEEIGGEVVQTTSFVINKLNLKNFNGNYIRLTEFSNSNLKEIKTLEAIKNPDCGYYYLTKQSNFKKIPGTPIAYWASSSIINAFEKGTPMNNMLSPKVGLQTGKNDLYLREWHEVIIDKISFNSKSLKESKLSGAKWFPYNKGGARKQWYGNYDYVVNWENDGYEIRNFKDVNGKVRSRPQNTDYYFKESITWNLITSGGFSIRYRESSSIHDVSGMSAFSNDVSSLKYVLALLSTPISNYIFKMLNPTLNLQQGDFSNFPIIEIKNKDDILIYSEENIDISKNDWNIYEISWGFKKHILINSYDTLIESVYEDRKNTINNRFKSLKENEEELNKIFIDVYGLENELTPEVSDKDITVTKIFDSKEDIYDDIKGNQYIQTKEDVIKSIISYAVGCMFGRYSLDEEGLIYAGGEWDSSRYKKFIPTSDNVLIISDDEYFEDDIVNRFVEFVKLVYGEETLDDNLEFISEALGGRGTPKEVIRNYFVRDFYKHHVQMYKKRPIYWLYDSGRNNGFMALVYMHRYNEDTTGVVRIDHLHKMQTAYEHRMDNLRYEITHSDNARDRNRAEKELDKLSKQLKESKDYDEKIGHLAVARIDIDLDDGVVVNHAKVQTDEKGKNLNILAKI